MSDEAVYNEQSLLQEIAKGDQQALATLVDIYSRRVFIHLLTFIKNYEAAEELSQDVFMKIWIHREELIEIENFSNYLFIITRNHLISYLRKKLPAITEPGEELLISTGGEPHTKLEIKELEQRIEKGIAQLRPQQQKIFRMSREQGMTYQQIAHELSLSAETVKWHLAEALNNLRTYFREHGDLLVLAFLAFITGG